jgi:hypothetical protein
MEAVCTSEILVYLYEATRHHVVLRGVMVIVLAIDPRFVGSNPDEDSEFLRAINMHSMTSFRG